MRLADCFTSIIAYISYFLQTVETAQPPYEKVKSDIQSRITDSEELFKKGGFPRENFEDARFAVFAWVDESLLNSNWQHKLQWQKSLLQRQYFDTFNAGDQFYERLNKLSNRQDVREVFYLCLAMGFTGRYCHADDKTMLERLTLNNLQNLMGSSVGVPSLDRGQLFAESYPKEVTRAGEKKAPSVLSFYSLFWILVPVGLFCLLFLIFWFILETNGESIIRMMV